MKVAEAAVVVARAGIAAGPIGEIRPALAVGEIAIVLAALALPIAAWIVLTLLRRLAYRRTLEGGRPRHAAITSVLPVGVILRRHGLRRCGRLCRTAIAALPPIAVILRRHGLRRCSGRHTAIAAIAPVAVILRRRRGLRRCGRSSRRRRTTRVLFMTAALVAIGLGQGGHGQ